MLSHGIIKIKYLLSESISFIDPIRTVILPSLVLTVFVKVICSVLILIVLGKRLSVIQIIIVM